MYDVAKRAGVTKQTVSNVVRGRQVVSPETKARVEAAIAELGYTPNMVARSLSTGTTMTVGFIVPTVAHPFYSEVVEEVETLLEDSGYHLLLATTRGDSERVRRQLSSLSSRSVDALLMAGDFDLGEQLAALGSWDVPVALCAWEIDPPPSLPVVTIDFEQAGYLAGRHLRELGHEQVMIVADLPAHRVRVAGMRRAFSEDGLSVPEGHLLAIQGSSPEAGYDAMERAVSLLRDGGLPTAVITSTDAIALGVMQALRERGLRIPEDVSVIGIDDIPQAAHAHPPLTTVALPKREMAQQAIGILLRAIAEKQPAAASLAMLRPEVVQRASSGPARRSER